MPRPSKKALNPCPMSGLLELLARPWVLHILWVLGEQGPTRFGALRRAVAGISARVLTQRLRELEDAGFVSRTQKPSIPPEVTYALTERMSDMQKILHALGILARRWQAEDGGTAALQPPHQCGAEGNRT